MVTIDDARRVAQTLAEQISPVAVIVFGSVARTGKGSDLDILVVTEQDNMHEVVGEFLRDYYRNFAIDYFVASLDMVTTNFRKGSPFLRMVQKEGRVLYMKNAIEEWKELAFDDLRQARYLLTGKFYRGACFGAQQDVEKAINWELLKRGWELEKIHNIRRLLNISEKFDLYIDCKDDDIDFMDSIYRGRYPAEEGLLPLKYPTREDASRAISIAEGIFSQLKLLTE